MYIVVHVLTAFFPETLMFSRTLLQKLILIFEFFALGGIDVQPAKTHSYQYIHRFKNSPQKIHNIHCGPKSLKCGQGKKKETK